MTNQNNLDELATIFQIYEDPDIDIEDVRDPKILEQFIVESQQSYQHLILTRRSGLKNAIGYIIATLNEDSDVDLLRRAVPEVYQRIWGLEDDREGTQAIIKDELDFDKYVMGMQHVLRLNAENKR